MRTTGRIAAVAAAMTACLAMGAAPASAKKCMRIAGQGTAVTNELATINAKDAFAQSLAASGAKAKGKQAVSCKYDLVISTCTVSQRACK